MKDLYERRNMRLVFQKHGFYLGGAEAALMTLTGRRVPRAAASRPRADADVPRVVAARAAVHARTAS